MKAYTNLLDACLMIWETNPKLRNRNKQVNFLSHTPSHNIGDIIVGGFNDGKFSCYIIEEKIKTGLFQDCKGGRFTNSYYHRTKCKHKFLNFKQIKKIDEKYFERRQEEEIKRKTKKHH